MWIPLLVRSETLNVVIIGGGPVACRKAEILCKYGVQSRLVCPHPPKLRTGLSPSPQWTSGTYDAGCLENATLVIAATDDREVNRQICRDAAENRIFALNASEVNGGSVCFPNVGKAGDITLTVSTGGASPTAGAQILSELLGTVADNHWPERIRLLGELRHALRKSEPDCSVRHERMREYGIMTLEELQKRRLEYED